MSRDPHALVGLPLIGLPGSGKSTVGWLVARRLGRPFVDVDHVRQSREDPSRPAPSTEQEWTAKLDMEERSAH